MDSYGLADTSKGKLRLGVNSTERLVECGSRKGDVKCQVTSDQLKSDSDHLSLKTPHPSTYIFSHSGVASATTFYENAMADQVASGSRGVDHGHRCENELCQDEHGLICHGEVKMVSPLGVACCSLLDQIFINRQFPLESDSRPGLDAPATPPDIPSLHSHNPWPDPEEADIEWHITSGPGGSVFISLTIRSSRRHPIPQDDQNEDMADFQQIFGTPFDPSFQSRQAGVSGPGALFTQVHFIGDGGSEPHIVGGRFIYTTTHLTPRDTDGAQPGVPLLDDLSGYASPPTPPSSYTAPSLSPFYY